MESLPPEVCSCSAIRQAARHMTRQYDEILSPAGIGLNQYSILAKLDRSGPNNLQDLAGLLTMDRSTLGHLLRPLEERRLITIKPSGVDRRQRIVALTKKGLALLNSAMSLWARAETRFGEVFGEANAAGLRAMMRQITRVDLGVVDA
jgi:DNA-binding MarR family transcriptional regulator